MKQYIDKSAVVAEIEKIYSRNRRNGYLDTCNEIDDILSFIDTLEVREVEEEVVNNDLEDYANKESESFAEREYEIDYIDRNALAKGYYWGVKAGAQWQKQKNTLEVKEVDLDKVIDKWIDDAAITHEDCSITDVISTAKHFFELGLKTQKGI